MKKRGNRFIDRAGERHLNYQGCWMTIIAYRGALDCDIEFDNRYQVTQTVYDSVKRGSIKNHYHPSVFGVGYFGVGRHKSKIDGKFTNEYLSSFISFFDLKFPFFSLLQEKEIKRKNSIKWIFIIQAFYKHQ